MSLYYHPNRYLRKISFFYVSHYDAITEFAYAKGSFVQLRFKEVSPSEFRSNLIQHFVSPITRHIAFKLPSHGLNFTRLHK